MEDRAESNGRRKHSAGRFRRELLVNWLGTAGRESWLRCGGLLVWAAFCLAALSPAQGADYPPISAAEKALTEVPGQPGSPAVVLFKKASLHFMEYPKDVYSSLAVDVRLKILTEDGKEHGEVEIPHSRYFRLRGLEGRTVQPDGTVVPLSAESIFEEQRSRSEKSFVTKLVFPAVDVGSILDYHYTIRWDSLYHLEPFQFHDVMPTLQSEIEYVKPANLGLKPWIVQRGPTQLQSESRETASGTSIRVWAANLRGIPDEPYSFPFADLTSRAMMIPAVLIFGADRLSLMEDWQSTFELFEKPYKEARNRDRKARKKAQELASGASSTLETIRRLHAFVRDEISSGPAGWVGVDDNESADRVLESGSGTPAAKGLLLQAMLSAMKIDSSLYWVADKTEGRIDLGVANPWWFESVLVAVSVDGETIYLDPNDRGLGMGDLSPYYEGTQALNVEPKKPEIVTLPTTAHDQHRRSSQLRLTIDEDGAVSGGGSMELTGHQAWEYLRFSRNVDMAELWTKALESDFERFEVSEVEVEENVDEQRVRVDWTLEQRPEEVLGDEVELELARPLGPTTQPFALPPNLRRNPVQLLHGTLNEAVATVRWPSGWELDHVPSNVQFKSSAGSVEITFTEGDEANELVYRRRFERTGYEYTDSESYGALRDLYEATSQADAERLVLLLDP